MALESGARGCGGVTRQRARRAGLAAPAMSLEQLDVWLRTLKPPARVDGASMLDGYLTAVIIGPCSIPPDEWFVDLLGDRGRIATAAGKTLAAMTAIVARFNAVSDGLATAPKRHAPIFEKTVDGVALPQPWCTGFLTAMRLRYDQWRPLLDLGQIHHGLMLPILLYCSDPSGQPLLGPPREGPETEEFLRTAYQDIPLVLPEIRDYWMPQRLKRDDRQA